MLQLLRHFSAQKELEVVPVLKLSRIKNRKAIESIIPGESVDLMVPWKLLAGKESLYHGPDFKLNVRGPFPRVVTIHDMVVFEEKYNRPDFFLRGIREMTEVLNSSSLAAVIVNSEFTKSQVLKYFPQWRERIHVTYLGCDREAVNPAEYSLALPEKYILFLGTLEKRKNVLGALRAFEILKAQGNRPEKLILAGAWGFGSEEIQRAIETSPVKEDIVHLNYVPDNKIAELYQRAHLFFFPSWYEGFGIPALEAMALGCPVVTSRGGALQEVCGEAALLVDPGNPDEMAQTLDKVLSDGILRESFVAKGLARARQFTWKKCAEETLEVYKKIVRKS